MPTSKPDLLHLSLTQLAELVEIDGRTVRRPLGAAGLEPIRRDRRTRFFDLRRALPVLLGGAALDKKQARARLDSARAAIAELELATKRKDLIPANEFEEALIAVTSAIKLRLGVVPTKAAPEVRLAKSDREAESVPREYIDEALTDLADAGDELLDRVEAMRTAEAVAAGAEAPQ